MAFIFVRLGLLYLWFLGLSFAIPVLDSSQQGNYPSYEYGFDPNSLHRRQSQPIIPITGALGGNGNGTSPPQRIEIRQFQQNTDLWTLYILGLDMMQYTNQSLPTSWYQITGIHGRPYLSWDGVPSAKGAQNNGYCSHVSILFPTWHRPYLALYEQTLYQLIQRIATYWPAGPVRDRYIAAAKNFRMPYWDWAAVPPSGQSVLPLSVGAYPAVSVDGPSGTQVIANPLFSYLFKPLNAKDLPDMPFRQWNRTLRYPTSTTNASAVSRNHLVAQQLDNNAPSFRNRLYNILVNYPDYATFSNEAWIPKSNPGNYDSIESIHDAIHGLTGSGGHMTYIDYSAFDPIFWLHHAMVDRIFALWQQLNPDSYVVPESSRYSTFTSPSGTTQDVNTPLTPFYNSTTGTFWTSQTARYTESFGYTYPETANPNGLSVDQMKAQVTAAVNKLYGSTAPASTTPKVKGRGVHLISTAGSKYREWIANIVVQKHALSAPFFIHVFLGTFSDEPFSWSFEPNLVGTHCVYVRADACASCNTESNQMVTGTVPLTHALIQNVQNGTLDSLDPEDVEPYLQRNLKYRVSLLDDTQVPNESVSGLDIVVVSSVVQRAGNNHEFPKWGGFQEHFQANRCH